MCLWRPAFPRAMRHAPRHLARRACVDATTRTVRERDNALHIGDRALRGARGSNKRGINVCPWLQVSRSWFIGDQVQQDGSLHLATPVDPLFIALPLLTKSSTQSVSIRPSCWECTDVRA